MKSKFSFMWRAVIAMVMVLSLSLVMAVPASAATAGTISLDADWYTLPDTVTVTLTDADLNTVGEAPEGGEIIGTGDGTTKAFTVEYSPIASVDAVMDLQADSILTIYGINYDTGKITLAAAPDQVYQQRFALPDIAAPVADDGLDTPIVAATELLITATESAATPASAAGTLTLTGTSINPLTLETSADTEDIVISLDASEALTYETTKYWTAIDADGIDITGVTGEFDLKIEETHTIAAEYSYHQTDEPVTVTAKSQTLGSTFPVELTEADPTTGIFTGTFDIYKTGGSGDLLVVDGDTIIVTYQDADPVQTRTDTARVDATLPEARNETPEDGDLTNDTTPTVAVDIVDLASGIAVDVDEEPVITMTFGVTGSLAPVTPTLTPITGGYHVVYQVPGVSPLAEDEYTAEVVAMDVAGNEKTFSWSFTIDVTEPTLDSAIADTTTTVVATFSDPLDEDTVETSDFLVDGSYPSAVAVGTGADANKVTLTVAAMATDATPLVTLTGNGVSDLAGNFVTEGEVEATDAIKPVVAIMVTPDPCGVGDATFNLTFSEVMKVLVSPTVTFTPATPGSPISVTGAWTTSTKWQGTKAVTDDMDGMATISVSGAKDMPENTMVADTDDTFTIDTSVAAPTFSPADGATIYTASPVIRITFSEVVTITAATFDGEDVDLTTTNNKTFKLATEALAAEAHTISVSAEDDLGNTGSPFTATFTVAVVLSYDIDLSAGWNLISLPLIPGDPSVDAVLSGISVPDTVNKVWAYDAETKTWSYYVPDPGIGGLSVMRDGAGYWIEMSDDATLTINGSVLPEPPSPPQSYDVYARWNLIGCTTQTSPIEADVYLASVDGKYTQIWGYDPSTGYFVVLPPVGTNEMLPGMGYWIWMTEDGVIVPVVW